MSDDRLSFATVHELGRMIRSGATSPTELAEHFLERLDSIGRRLNAVVTLTPEIARAQAAQAEEELVAGIDRGPLHGIPYGAKDLLAVPGHPTTWGAAPLAEQQFDDEAAVVERLREAGAVLVAKLAMVEIAGGFGYEQPNAALTGPGRNGWDEQAWAGGSSSGSGAAVAAGCIPFAIGTETWGSIHCPAAFNGITGLRPTYGRVSRRGAMALSWTMDKIGPMARTVDDCASVYAAIAGPDRADPPTLLQQEIPAPNPGAPLRFGVCRGAFEHAQPEVIANAEASIAILAEIGEVEEVDLPDFPWDAAASTIVISEAASAFEEFVSEGRAAGLTAPEDRAGLHHGLTIPAVDYLRALRIRRAGGRAMDALLSNYDAIVGPTYPHVASPIDRPFATYFDREQRHNLGGVGNLCGLPSISVPNGFGERGLPTGLELLGRAYDEERILAAARALQIRTDWHKKHPSY
jgi:aspartyl-tRNA(Asn)/glutamyl-tRNA(Gln) amidotransferase subunit A